MENAAELSENTGMNEHAIELEEGKQPSFGPIYSPGLVELETLKMYIKTNLANSFIRPSTSPIGVPILFDRKLDGSLYLCMDYWGLNNITIKNQYPLPFIRESLDKLGRARRSTQLDLTNAYHRMRICEDDKWKTIFRTQYGYFQYQVMLFGLSNGPVTFQGYVNKIFAKKLDIFIIMYLDNILINIENSSQPHVETVYWVLNQLRKYLLFINLKKCCFHQDEVYFLGYVVLFKGISIEAKRIKVVREWPEPKSIRDIQVFLGFANFYWQFIQGFSRIAAPFTSMLKTTNEPAPSRNNNSRSAFSRNDDSRQVSKSNDGNGKINGFGGDGVEYTKNSGKSKGQKTSKSWKSAKLGKNLSKSGNSPNFGVTEFGQSFLTSKARSTFNRLWLAFSKAPILQHFYPECHIWIETDASGYAIGSMLS